MPDFSPMNPKVDGYVRKSKQFQDILQALRTVISATELNEEVKWRVPCYTWEGRNIVILGRFKEYCAMTFVKGVLLKDAKKILAKPGENTQGARVIRFTTAEQVTKLDSVLKAYIREAIQIEKSGAKVKLKKISQFKRPAELQIQLDQDAELNKSFTALTPGRQRRYILYFSSAKQSQTRQARVARFIPQILAGKGMDD